MPTSTKYHTWAFTWFNWDEDVLAEFETWADDAEVRYLCYGKEVSPETGKSHLQGFVWFEAEKTKKQVQMFFKNKSLHVERCRGTPFQNLVYCSKETIDGGEFFESGPLPEGMSPDKIPIDWEEVTCMDYQVANRHVRRMNPLLWATPSVQFLLRSLIKPYIGEMKVYWFWGAAGTGKSRAANEMTTGIVSRTSSGFMVYRGGHKAVRVEEADKNNKIPLDELLQLTDRYEYYLNTRNNETPRDFDTIVFTSTVHPSVIYNEHYEQLARRITEIREFN